jgi:tRNA A-37 threonylcarbamoyl transferase component Bud32
MGGLGDSDPHLSPLVVEADQKTDDILTGTRLGKYEILRRISVGGMAEIFLARAAGLPGFKKLVVIKRILPQLAQKSEFLEMFLDEARIAATLQHPNIVQTYDVAVAGGNYFIAMEFLHGEDLHALLRTVKRRNERIPIEHALQIVISLCAGLHYAHDREDFDGKHQEIVHRDVTPANIIVTYEGSVKLLDFGIARAASRANQTRSGTLKGKIHYMSPEQAQGQPVDRRADVYAAGILLYELTMMRRLYKGETDYQILHNIVNGTLPKPTELDASYDRDLEAIVMHALQKDLTKRYQSAMEMQRDLEDFARKRGLYLSPSALKEYMAGLFGERINAWKQAQAEGKALPEPEVVISYEEGDDDVQEGPPTEGAKQQPRARFGLREQIFAAAAALVVIVAAIVFWHRHPTLKPVVPPVAVAPPAVIVAPPAPAEKLPAPPPAVPAKPGSLRLVTHPHGATLTLDGKRLSQVSNTVIDDLDAGDHVLVVEKRGHESAERRFTVTAGGEIRLSVELRTQSAPAAAPAPKEKEKEMKGEGTLAITSSPWCKVDVDGKDRGQTPLKLTVPAGVHKIELSNPDFKIKRQITVTVHPGETVRKSLEFTR